MRKLRYQLVDVFTNERFGGNQLAVFTNARGLSPEMMQHLTRELNLSECTFVLPPKDQTNDWWVRIFTPGYEMPMAGHPTVGTAFVLAREHLVEVSESKPSIRFEEGVGVIPVTFTFDEGAHLLINMSQPMPTFGPIFEDRAAMAELLSLDVSELADYPLEVVSCGVPFVYVPLKSLAAVQAIKVRVDIWERLLKNYAAPHIYAFTTETVLPGSTVHSRMFAPAMGIGEDPATGAACGPLGCYLVRHGLVQGNPAIILNEQGFEMGRRSFIHIEIEQTDGQFSRVSVGGECVYIGEGHIEI
jgi:trans-2,3-dihydro-3-hydroxyanthranilate isomerase